MYTIQNSKFKIQHCLFLVLLVLLVPCFAFAQEPNPGLPAIASGAGVVGEAVASLLTGVVFPVLAALLVGLVGVVLNKLRSKYNLDISAATEQRLADLARSGIAYAEEKAAAYAKAELGKITGAQKLDLAIAHILNAAPTVSRQQADVLVHAMLGRAFGPGATGRDAT